MQVGYLSASSHEKYLVLQASQVVLIGSNTSADSFSG